MFSRGVRLTALSLLAGLYVCDASVLASEAPCGTKMYFVFKVLPLRGDAVSYGAWGDFIKRRGKKRIAPPRLPNLIGEIIKVNDDSGCRFLYRLEDYRACVLRHDFNPCQGSGVTASITTVCS